jgi:protein-tyrosine phosphatase
LTPDSTETATAAARRWSAIVAGESVPGEPPTELEIVFVCTGNRFRSPLAAALLAKASGDPNVRVSSAGTLDLGAVSALPEAIEHGRRLGVDLTSHRARSVRDVDLRSADLVVGFERIHVATAVVDAGAQRDRSFTLPELVDLLDTRAASAREGIARANARRQNESGTSLPLEIADPLGKGRGAFREAAGEIDDLVAKLAAGLFPRR